MKTLDKLTLMEITACDLIYLDGEPSDADELFEFAQKRNRQDLEQVKYLIESEDRKLVLRVRQ